MNKINTHKYLAKTLFGLEEILADELQIHGADNIKIKNRAVEFNATLESLYRINLGSRVSLKILKPIYSFTANNADQIYINTKKYSWHKLIKPSNTFSVESVVNSSKITHSKYAALKLKDAIVDQIRSHTNKRPNVDVKYPNFRIHLHIDKNRANILLDSSGESLHKRGYRLSGEKAPLNEVLAAGMIKLSGWDGKSNFIDPMCGSGTLVIEAALLAKNIAPNLNRKYFGFMNWKSYDDKLFKEVKKKLISEQNNFNYKIIGNDINESAIKTAFVNAKKAGIDNLISFHTGDLSNLQHDLNSGVMITNPPYGERLKKSDINQFYKKLGDTLKQNFSGFDAWILSSNKDALKQIGLRTSRRLLLYNGALECKFHNYKMYKGSKKKKYERL